jgi:hypothetical protein
VSKGGSERDKAEHELIREIEATWLVAKSRLEKLKSSVEENQRLGDLRRKLDEAQRSRDQALIDLGRKALEFLEGSQLPPDLEAALRLARTSQARLAAHKSAITDLLAESEGLQAEKAGSAKKRK